MTCASPDPGQARATLFAGTDPAESGGTGWTVAQGQRDPGMGAGPSPMASQSEQPTQRRRFVKMASAWRSLAASLTSARKPTQQVHVPCSVLSCLAQ